MNPTLSPFEMPLSHLGLPIKASRRVKMGEYLILGPLGFIVHPVDYEKLLDRSIDDWEAVRRAAARSFDERWSEVRMRLLADSFPDRAHIWKAELKKRLVDYGK